MTTQAVARGNWTKQAKQAAIVGRGDGRAGHVAKATVRGKEAEQAIGEDMGKATITDSGRPPKSPRIVTKPNEPTPRTAVQGDPLWARSKPEWSGSKPK